MTGSYCVHVSFTYVTLCSMVEDAITDGNYVVYISCSAVLYVLDKFKKWECVLWKKKLSEAKIEMWGKILYRLHVYV
jgi:hypothetical protein